MSWHPLPEPYAGRLPTIGQAREELDLWDLYTVDDAALHFDTVTRPGQPRRFVHWEIYAGDDTLVTATWPGTPGHARLQWIAAWNQPAFYLWCAIPTARAAVLEYTRTAARPTLPWRPA